MVNHIQTSLCFSWYDNKMWYMQILTFCFYSHFSKNSNILGRMSKMSMALTNHLCSVEHFQNIITLMQFSCLGELSYSRCYVLPKAYTKWWVLTSSFCIFNLIKVSLSNTFSTLKIFMLKNVTFFSHKQHSNMENILNLIANLIDCFTFLSNFYKLFTASHAV